MIRYLIAVTWCILTTSAFSQDEEAKEEFFLSSPEQIATINSSPSYLIGGLISPLSGHPSLRQTDLIVNGAQKIVLSRTYIPPYMPCSFPKPKHNQEAWDKYNLYQHVANNYKGWLFYPHLKLQFNLQLKEVLLTDSNGISLSFRFSGPNYSVATLASPPYALSNAAGDTPNGKFDPRNTRITFEENGNKIKVYAPDGSIRSYYRDRFVSRTTLLYLLEKEILPNGKILRYYYNDSQQPVRVESLDPKERYVYASININGSPWERNCHFTSSSGMIVDYNYQRRTQYIKFKEKIKKSKITTEYNCTYPPILSSVSSPSYRHETLDYNDKFLLNSFSGKDDVFLTENIGFGDAPQHYRVQKLLLPVGNNDSFAPVYELNYQPPIAGVKEGTTRVKNSDETSINYYFSKNLLTTAIQYFGQDGSLKKEKSFSWDDKNWLKAIEIRDNKKNLLYRKSYEYDHFGNPILELFTGYLTGDENQETFTTKRTFSEDGRNLLLREETEDGKVICFSYLPNTNLVTNKLTKDGDRIILREFSVYDDCNNLIQKISDDGTSEDRDNLSNVAQRTITTYTLRQSAPFLHLPEWTEETYWESGIEKTLKKSHLIYDQHGNVAQEKVYDAEGTLAYTISRTYNERGDVLSETNSLGQEAVYTYDARGNFETSINFSKRISKTFRHDTKGRLRKLTEKGDDGVVHVLSSDYDFHDRLICKKDPFQNCSQYAYDPLVNKVTKTEFPMIASIDGEAISVTTLSTYDPFGRELTKTDPNGNITTYRYNAYGSPIEIHYPNGGREYFRYEKNGKLRSHTNLDGLTIHYKNDILGRVISKTYISAEGNTLAEEIFTYNGFNLLTETNKEGNVKQYSYDGAGRKIREEFCGQVTDFSYDSLGWLATICKHNEDNTLFIHYKRDLKGRILEEHNTDIAGNILYKISYSYDGDGNQKTITHYINGKEAVDTFAYDSFCRLVEEKDAMNYVTKTLYDESYINALGQKVLQTVTIDPRHITSIVTKDALSRTVKQETLNPQRTTLSYQEMIQDPQGNLLYQRDHVYENGHFLNTQIIKYTYTPDNRIASLTRAFGTKDARTTTYTHLPSGRTSTKTLPDGMTLVYSYHPLGFMSHLDSSDGKIHHAFEYDLMGHLIYASDENQNIVIKRKIDPFGNVLQEVFPYGFEVKKDYDDLNRLVSLRMGSQGEVLYSYDPLFLRGVTRTSSRGKVLYEHTYEEYDEAGNLVSENLIGNLGQITHMTDARGQKELISSPYFSQECGYDAVGNLVSNIIDRAERRYSYDGLSQLSSENGSGQSYIYAHDSLYNRTQKNGTVHEINELNEVLSLENGHCSYDLNGNQILRQTPSETFRFTYDPLHRLIEATSEKQKINFVYDPLGRRLSKIVFIRTAHGWKETSREHYLYHGQNEIGAFASPNEPTNLRVLGLAQYKDSPATVGVEIGGQVVAPIVDVQGNIRRLIDLDSKTITSHYDFTAFGEEQRANSDPTSFNPWRFASKRFDPELGLIYFGKRYYDPLLGRWLTTDPAGFVDGANLYQYVFNNPFRYRDPDGQFIIVLPLLALTWKVVAVAAVTAYVAYELEHQHSNSAFARSFNSAVHQVVQNIGGISQYALNQKLAMGKKQIDVQLPNSPDELLNDPNWEETSHPEAKENGHRTFENTKTGETIRYDAGKPGTTGHKAEDHWHRHNPDSTGDIDKYLDAKGNPVPDGHPDSHLYPR
ncbi:MAG: RHS repeat-associated core domain-containing protein [Chlamydiae bacterium]|nr:RHS repeat-associated core domain-containing protein [Chlamydiota bacterium]